MPGDEENNNRKPFLNPVLGVGQIKNLEHVIQNKDILIKEVIDVKTHLEIENKKLERDIKEKLGQIQVIQKERNIIEENYKEKLKLENEILLQKDIKIINLEKQIKEISLSKTVDEVIMKDLTNTKLQFQEVTLYNNIKMEELIETKSNLAITEEKLKNLNFNFKNLENIIESFQNEKSSVKTELDIIKGTVQTSFTPEDISSYLNSTIETFNNKVNTVASIDSAVNYVINGMDVDLKTQVYKDKQKGIMFNSADIASKSEDSLSSIKFSIRAIPKL